MVQSECNGNLKGRVQYWEEWVRKASGRKVMGGGWGHYRTGKREQCHGDIPSKGVDIKGGHEL